MPEHLLVGQATSMARSNAQRGRSRRWVGSLKRARYVRWRRTTGSP